MTGEVRPLCVVAKNAGKPNELIQHVRDLEEEILMRGGGILVYIPGVGFSVATHTAVPQDQAAVWELFLTGVALKAKSDLKFVADIVEDAERIVKDVSRRKEQPEIVQIE